MSTPHHLIHTIRPASAKDPRCLRHTAWMAACDDCRRAHAELLARPRPAASR